MKLTDIEEERLGVAELHLRRLLATYKAKSRKGKDLERLKLFERALQALEATRLL